MPDGPVNLTAEEVASGKFVALRRIHWRDSAGTERVWDSAERVRDSGAVLIVATLVPSGRIVLVRQYRPPAAGFVVEFPAGLVDSGESAEAAAARELREETGYVASDLTVFPPSYTSPGLSSESVAVVLARIDEAAPENQRPQTAFDDGEDIQTLLVERGSLLEFYRQQSASGTRFDAKLAAYIVAGEGFAVTTRE